MDKTFLIGLIGSIILVTGAAWHEKKSPKHPTHSIKNWLFAIGGFTMLAYSILGYFEGGPIFFIFLQGLVGISSILMMINAPHRVGISIITLAGTALLIWSLTLFEDYSTVFFIFGLIGIGIGYTLTHKPFYRGIALTLGSILIAVFSYIGANWIFFWLNLFFAAFSAIYLIRGWKKRKTPKSKLG